jgi:hypothetical protein
MNDQNKIAAEEVKAEELDLFAEEIEDRSNAAQSSTLFCLSTEGCVCCISSLNPAAQ